MKKFAAINKAAKVRRLNKIKRLMSVPEEYHELYEYYNKKGKNEDLLYLMRELILEQDNLSDEVSKLLKD